MSYISKGTLKIDMKMSCFDIPTEFCFVFILAKILWHFFTIFGKVSWELSVFYDTFKKCAGSSSKW